MENDLGASPELSRVRQLHLTFVSFIARRNIGPGSPVPGTQIGATQMPLTGYCEIPSWPNEIRP